MLMESTKFQNGYLSQILPGQLTLSSWGDEFPALPTPPSNESPLAKWFELVRPKPNVSIQVALALTTPRCLAAHWSGRVAFILGIWGSTGPSAQADFRLRSLLRIKSVFIELFLGAFAEHQPLERTCLSGSYPGRGKKAWKQHHSAVVKGTTGSTLADPSENPMPRCTIPRSWGCQIPLLTQSPLSPQSWPHHGFLLLLPGQEPVWGNPHQETAGCAISSYICSVPGQVMQSVHSRKKFYLQCLPKKKRTT